MAHLRKMLSLDIYNDYQSRDLKNSSSHILMGTNTIHTVDSKLEIQYIVFITIIVDTISRRRGRLPLALSVEAFTHIRHMR